MANPANDKVTYLLKEVAMGPVNKAIVDPVNEVVMDLAKDVCDESGD